MRIMLNTIPLYFASIGKYIYYVHFVSNKFLSFGKYQICYEIKTKTNFPKTIHYRYIDISYII